MPFSCNMKLLTTDPSSDALAFLEENKYRLLFAEVKRVLTGSILMVSLLHRSQHVKLIIAGVQAPSPGKDAIQEAHCVDDGKKGRKFVSCLPSKFDFSGAEAFGKEAKEFTEIRLMHKDVRIILEGIDKYNNFVGLVYYADGEVAKNLGLELIERGLAKYDQWSGNLLEESTRFDFMNAEIEAQKSRLRIWDDSTSSSSNSEAVHDKNFAETIWESPVQEQVEKQVMEQHANHIEEQVDQIHDLKEQVEDAFWEPVDDHPIYDSKEQVENLFWEQVQNHIKEEAVADQTHDIKQEEQVQNHIEEEVVADQTHDTKHEEQVRIDYVERVQNIVEEQAEEINHFEEGVANGPPNAKRSHKEEIKVVVTNVLGGCKFYIQSVDDLNIVSIQKRIASFKLSPQEQEQLHHQTTKFNPKMGDFILAQCKTDDSWNRAMIVDTPADQQEAHDEESSSDAADFEVFYVDNGNKERISLNRLRPLVFSISNAPGVAQLCSLAHLIIHDDTEAENFLRAQLLSKDDSKQFTAVVEERSTDTSQLGSGRLTQTMLKVTLIEEDEDVSVNAKLLQAGLARLDKSGEDGDEISDGPRKYEDEARNNKCGMWKYNEDDDDDVLSDEDDREIAASCDEVSMEEKVVVNGCDDDVLSDEGDQEIASRDHIIEEKVVVNDDDGDVVPTLVINDINFPKLAESIRLVR